MRQTDIVEAIERIAPPWAAAGWDLSGMQVASSRDEIGMAAVILDPCPAAIARALEAGAQFLVSHHPLSLKPELPNKMNSWRESLRLLLGADAALYAAHTSLDVNMDGPAGWFGKELGLVNREILEPCHPSTPMFPRGLGFGEIGDLPEPEPIGDFIGRALKILGLNSAIACGTARELAVRRIAYCPGSGASMLPIAGEKGAQAFITGDVKYHVALEAEIMVLDVGHHSLEEEMARRFADILRQALPDIPVLFFPSTSPFRCVGAGG